MPFSELSKKNLATAHEDLQKLFNEIIKKVDCTVLIGYRCEEAQNLAYRTKKSDKPWPESKHNKTPSLAVDVAPYPIRWEDEKRFAYFAGYVMGVAAQLGISLRCGIDWDGDFDLKDQKLSDIVHFELVL